MSLVFGPDRYRNLSCQFDFRQLPTNYNIDTIDERVSFPLSKSKSYEHIDFVCSEANG